MEYWFLMICKHGSYKNCCFHCIYINPDRYQVQNSEVYIWYTIPRNLAVNISPPYYCLPAAVAPVVIHIACRSSNTHPHKKVGYLFLWRQVTSLGHHCALLTPPRRMLSITP